MDTAVSHGDLAYLYKRELLFCIDMLFCHLTLFYFLGGRLT